MVDRSVSRQRLVFAAVITLIIFALGFSLGVIVDYERLEYSTNQNSLQELNYNSLQLQYLYMSRLDTREDACPLLRAALQNSIEELGYSLEQYEEYRENALLDEDRYTALQRKYLQDNLRYWIFSSQLQEECEADVVNVLYFYSEEDCPVCANQGTVLTYFKNKLQDRLLVFPINTDLKEEEQFLELLTLTYNVTELPTLIINGEKHGGVVPRAELSRIICEQTDNKETCLL